MEYVDGYVLPVPKKNLPAYRRMALKAGKVWREHGALEFRECVGDDLETKMAASFPRTIKLKRSETVIFSWIVFKSRAHRDALRFQANGLWRVQSRGRRLESRSGVKSACHLFVIDLAAIFSASLPAQTINGSASAPLAQQTHALQREVPHKVNIQYLVFLPKGYDKSANQWPLILYLHGGSLRGEDISQMSKIGLVEKVERDPNFPFIVVSPQYHKGEIWTDADALGAVLDEVGQTHRVDPERIYVTGHSMGGRGALYAAYKMPDRFAAVVSLAPVDPITAWAEKLATVPLWLFHGPKDQFTPMKEVEELVRATKAAGGHPQLTVLAGRDHYILDVYDRPDIYEWLAQQKRRPASSR